MEEAEATAEVPTAPLFCGFAIDSMNGVNNSSCKVHSRLSEFLYRLEQA